MKLKGRAEVNDELVMDSTSLNNELVELLLQMLATLQRKFPLPACIQADMISPHIFLSHGASTFLTNGIIYYLICIVDSSTGKTIQWPIGTQSQAKFNQSIVRAVTQLLKDHGAFQLSLRLELGSILRDRKGVKFNKFMFELARNALRATITNQGSRAVPVISLDVPVDDRAEKMMNIRDKLSSCLANKRSPTNDTQDEQLLGRLYQKKIELQKRIVELIQMCPSKYKLQFTANNCSLQQQLLVTNQWQADLSNITNEQAHKTHLLTSHSNGVETIKTIIRDKLASEDLVNDQNGPILVKTANENDIQLATGGMIALPNFMESSSVIIEKLKTLVINNDIEYLVSDFSLPLEQSARILSKLNQEVSDGELRVERLKELCNERQRTYDEGVAAEGGHEFPLPVLELEVRLDSPPAPYNPSHLIQSPGIESPKRVLEEAKRRRRDAAGGDVGRDEPADTPKSSSVSSRPRNHANSSMSQLTKSVLQKQTLSSTLASHGNSTVGDMIPLSSSSPVSMRGNVQKPGPSGGSRPARCSLADILNELDESNLPSLELSDESYSMNSTFGSPEPPMIQPPRKHARSNLEGFVQSSSVVSRLPVPQRPGSGGMGNDLPSRGLSKPTGAVKQRPVLTSGMRNGPQPTSAPSGLEQNDLVISMRRPTTAPAASPSRPPRRSIQDIIERYRRFKANSTNTEVRDKLIGQE